MPSAAGMGLRAVGIEQALDAFEQVKSGVQGGSGWVVGVGAEYGVYVELGTRHMAAQPYLFPAARETLNQDLPKLEQQAQDIPGLVRLVALEIEAKAKRKAPVDTGNLRSSIEAFPADAHP